MQLLKIAGLLVCFGVVSLHAEEHPKISERPEVLKALDGDWVMSGDVMGKPVTYRMNAGPTLQGTFTEIHMDDVQVPSQYEARVLIGYDSESSTIIAHWLDSFGAKYSVPHGTGGVTDNSIQFSIPYGAASTFRDTFTYNPETNTWVFVLESSKADGTWKHFARYDVYRPKQGANKSMQPTTSAPAG
ncbi:DUF1579 family protein [Shewanella salipaludis]|uniref:DUF1579 domain-containing protein n=1 Tax=Shewanella salipaludis TaxID=2723052 RepID=A0A972FRA4_9GAMM|nr:DUF1579 family protein [Shewanella salipaludis]NMH64713.1 DUF1579 domain-containing protein [Shewanella salipaludis]